MEQYWFINQLKSGKDQSQSFTCFFKALAIADFLNQLFLLQNVEFHGITIMELDKYTRKADTQ